MKNATLADVAKRAGVSTFTASRSLNGKEHVAETTRARVLQAAKALNYTVSRSAAALASGRTQRVALLICESFAANFNGELQEGLYDVLQPEHYDLLVYRAGDDRERSAFFKHLPANRNADALIVSFSVTDEEQQSVKSMGMPIVTVNALDHDYCQGSVAIDDIAAETGIVRYLSALGHRRFCFIDYSTHPWGEDNRIKGYRQAIKSNDLTDIGTFILDRVSDRPAKQAVAQILACPERPTALVCWSDDCALAILAELSRSNINVPGEMSVIGFDGLGLSRIIGLSSVAQPARELGRVAAHKTLDLLNGVELQEPHTVLPTTIIPGDTTGPAPRHSSNATI